MKPNLRSLAILGTIGVTGGVIASGAFALSAGDPGVVKVSTPAPTSIQPVKGPIPVPGTDVRIPAAAADQVDVNTLRVSVRADGLVHLVGTKDGLVCLVSTPQDADGNVAAVACDTASAAAAKGIYLATESSGRLVGAAYAGITATPFSLPATGGEVRTPTAEGTTSVSVGRVR